MNYTIANLEKDYEIELDKIVNSIRRQASGVRRQDKVRVLLQLPDGLKPWAVCIVDYLREKCDAEIRVWLGSCFGACDTPLACGSSQFAVRSSQEDNWDLIIQFGHARWK